VADPVRGQAAASLPDTPCNNKEIERTPGIHLQLIRGANNLEKALAIVTRKM